MRQKRQKRQKGGGTQSAFTGFCRGGANKRRGVRFAVLAFLCVLKRPILLGRDYAQAKRRPAADRLTSVVKDQLHLPLGAVAEEYSADEWRRFAVSLSDTLHFAGCIDTVRKGFASTDFGVERFVSRCGLRAIRH
jgi:hypothetical protein